MPRPSVPRIETDTAGTRLPASGNDLVADVMSKTAPENLKGSKGFGLADVPWPIPVRVFEWSQPQSKFTSHDRASTE